LLKFGFRRERDQQVPVPHQWQIKLSAAVVLEKKRDYVGVNYNSPI
jgi:hypothetical protein